MVAALELQDIHKRFGAVDVLRGVGLSLEAGRVHALAGENGAGKSTLVKIIGGVYRPDGGRVIVNGEERAVCSAPSTAANAALPSFTSIRRCFPT